MAWSYTLRQLAEAIGSDTNRGDVTFRRASTDTRTLMPGDVFFALRGEHFDGNRFVRDAFMKGAAGAVTTETSEYGPCLVVRDPLEALQRFASFHRRHFDIPLFALTGSCGKTTAKDMTARLLATRYRVVKTQGNLNNEIGCPQSLLQMDAETDMAVIEMGANHPGEIARLCELARPTESAITMIAPAHLEGFGSIENVAKAKAEIVGGLSPGGVFYVNVDDPRCVRIAESFSGEKIRFGQSGDVVLESCEITGPGEMRLCIHPVGALRLPLACRAHAVNVLLAVAVALRHGVTEFEGPLREAAAATSRFRLLPLGPLTIMDDSYNANPASMSAALQALAEWPTPGARFAVLGEMLELGETATALHAEIGERAAALRTDHLFALGPHAHDMIHAARAAGMAHAEVFDDPNDIADAIRMLARPGDVCLVKGSRGMRMERVIEALRERYA
ncbi:MAG TPA: UDP-N-acetylmuramoyl-tripeptide--D-alanyl-D-alanine ligase [Candidatus Hydrogenedentes bacterium]|nr:UDP-N-acetylmuramoyl-tripeptide--D-alanyl-D-alanine ligase [Candidatus Hydrogenedentota bacterium]HPC16174.1 UDP-N-acetylmuramoyl-tripeptide--D-alanyl-D-alanine ligase [Candidatus Hydrogenedentota bacterium]HRT18614.1 UDP-N-acetylmuramoyl-tripeptide--D-alanyl-D-alanine ligase [Candidatus Hydrogenedentota bacterium]HRT63634.1 UDP-N-acetylmuramoyl-tripeptide--D-alanyl-D-alanine ligase [Candidatus Hydrogenedentota bacterium]